MKTNLITRLKNVLDVAEDFIGIGIDVSTISKNIANSTNTNTDDILYDKVYNICNALATHNRLAAFDFLSQLVTVLPHHFLLWIAKKTEGTLMNNSMIRSLSSLEVGYEGTEEREGNAFSQEYFLWAMSGLSLKSFHIDNDQELYITFQKHLINPLFTNMTISLLSCLYQETSGIESAHLEQLKIIAVDNLSTLIRDLDGTRVISTVTSSTIVIRVAKIIDTESILNDLSSTPLSLPSIPCVPFTLSSSPSPVPLAPSSKLSTQIFPHSNEESTELLVTKALTTISSAMKLLQDEIGILKR
jgi:hypothetical protein